MPTWVVSRIGRACWAAARGRACRWPRRFASPCVRQRKAKGKIPGRVRSAWKIGVRLLRSVSRFPRAAFWGRIAKHGVTFAIRAPVDLASVGRKPAEAALRGVVAVVCRSEELSGELAISIYAIAI